MANNKSQVKSNLDELNRLIKCLKDDKFVRIGIIGSKASQQHDSYSRKTNAEIGGYHEFGGTSKNGKEQPPQRSFLWMPLTEQLKFDNSEMKELKKVLWKQLFVKKSPNTFYKTLLDKALDVVEEAFYTEGFGQWKPLTYKTHKLVDKKKGLKEGRQILTDTRKLRHSIGGKIMKRK